MTTPANHTDHDAPSTSTRMAAEFQFTDQEPDEAADGAVPVRIFARQPEPVNHWYWGRIVHDMAGLTVHKDSLPIDYCHDPGEILGYVDNFDATPEKGLVCFGYLLPDRDERAAEVIAKQKDGVPYEASIDWTAPAVMEWVDEGASAEVNGFTFEGPGYIARKWGLRGLAVCPYGADMNTETTFDRAGDVVGVTIFSDQPGGPKMPKTTKGPAPAAPDTTKDTEPDVTPADPPADPPATPADPPAADDDATPADPPADPPATPADPPADDASKDSTERAELRRFATVFGNDAAAEYILSGKSFSEALAADRTRLTAENKTLTDEVAKLTADLATARAALGDDAAEFQAEGTTVSPEQAAAAQKLGSAATAALAAKYGRETPAA